MRLQHIIFTGYDSEHDDLPPHDTLYNVEGVVMHGAGLESVAKVAEYLAQWDSDMIAEEYSDEIEPADDSWVVRPHSPADSSPWQVYDYVELAQAQVGDYVLAGTRGGFSSVCLYRVVPSALDVAA